MLKVSDTIALFCTGANALNRQEPLAAQALLKEKYHLNSIFHEDTYRYLPPKSRAEYFLEHLFDKNVKALWAFRGGEGTADTIPFIHKYYKKIAKLSPKPIIGFSDITPLLIYFAQIYHWPTIHGPGAIQLIKHYLNNGSWRAVFQFLLGQCEHANITQLKPLNSAAKVNKQIHGELIGGNLSLLNISIADIWEINTRNKIIIIEEVNEKPHVVKRTLNYLQRLEKFKHAKAIVLGNFSYSPDTKLQTVIGQVLKNFAEECTIPVVKTDQFGHGKKNFPLRFASKACLDLSTGTLIS